MKYLQLFEDYILPTDQLNEMKWYKMVDSEDQYQLLKAFEKALHERGLGIRNAIPMSSGPKMIGLDILGNNQTDIWCIQEGDNGPAQLVFDIGKYAPHATNWGKMFRDNKSKWKTHSTKIFTILDIDAAADEILDLANEKDAVNSDI